MAKTQDQETVEVVPAGKVIIPNNVDHYTAGAMSFTELMQEADVVAGGGDLLKADDLDALVGVPFVVIGGTFRNDKMRRFQGIDMRGDYVTVECLLADEEALKRARITDWEDRGLYPGMPFLFNDGSTGVRRQIVSYLVAREYIVLGDKPAGELKSSGGLGESDYDMPVHMWKDMREGEVKFDGGDTVSWKFTLSRGLVARRGLRISEYEHELYGDGRTRYLA